MENRLLVSASPHIAHKDSVQKIMFGVVIALLPAAIGGVYFFGAQAAWTIVLAILSAMITEALIEKLTKKPITIADGSAIVTGILLAFNVPPEVPWWIPVIGSAFAIAIGKIPFGGLGYNPMNPALLGRAFLLASWPSHMTIFKVAPRGGSLSGINPHAIVNYGLDAITSATPLNVFKTQRGILSEWRDVLKSGIENPVLQAKANLANNAISQLSDSYANLFWGKVGGCIGETSVFLLLIGALYLIYKRYIGLRIPLTYIGTVALLTWIFAGTEGFFSGDPLFQVLSGGLILGAFFMATDMVTSPVTPKGRVWFGFGCGVITVIIRLVGGYPEGVSYSILLMNLTVPLLDRYTKPKTFGKVEQK
ncbi:MAG: RnfABCDGE type electron transport complex subunit D [Calditrichaeota bacterium]|nr:RnfABCDGE type electron transport complex subunit D [Calditrichota bacterium]